MTHYGQLTGILDGVAGTWLVPLDETGAPALPLAFIPAERMPGEIPVWSIALPIDYGDGATFTADEEGDVALLMMRRRMAEARGDFR